MNVCLYLGLSFEKPFLEQVCFGREEVATESPETNYLHFMTLMMMKTTMTMLMMTTTMLMTTTSKTTRMRMRMMMRITAIECAARAGAAATARSVCRLAFLLVIVGFLYFVLLVFKYFVKIHILIIVILYSDI